MADAKTLMIMFEIAGAGRMWVKVPTLAQLNVQYSTSKTGCLKFICVGDLHLLML